MRVRGIRGSVESVYMMPFFPFGTCNFSHFSFVVYQYWLGGGVVERFADEMFI